MLVKLSGLYRYVWYAHSAWPVATGSNRNEVGESCHDGPGHGRRWRRLRHWLRPLRTRYAPQRRPALPGDGQSDLRAHYGPDIAHQPHWHEDQEHALREYRVAVESYLSRSGCGGDLRRARVQRRSKTPHRAD